MCSDCREKKANLKGVRNQRATEEKDVAHLNLMDQCSWEELNRELEKGFAPLVFSHAHSKVNITWQQAWQRAEPG